jgi:single-strand DNA-binding protein
MPQIMDAEALDPGRLDAGNRTDDPELRHTEGGIARAMFRVAISRRRQREASFVTVVVRRDQAEHAEQSLSKGIRVVVVGRLQQRAWTAEDGSARSTVEVVDVSVGDARPWARMMRMAKAASSRFSTGLLGRRPEGSCRTVAAVPWLCPGLRRWGAPLVGTTSAPKACRRRVRGDGCQTASASTLGPPGG